MSKTKAKEWEGVTGGKTLGQKGLLFLFHWFNVTVGYFFLSFTVPFYMLFARKRYLAIYRYFKKHFSYSPLKAFYKTYKNHFVFGKCMLDRFAVYAGRKNFFNVEITGNDHFLHLLEEKKGFIIASSHVGNFELSGYLLKQDKKRINALIFSGESEEVMKNRTKILNTNNISVIPVLDDMSHLFIINDALSNGDIVNMPCDRMFGSDKSVECEFLSGKADFPIGAFTLAVHFDVPVIAIFVMKKSATNYHIYVKPVSLDKTLNVSKREKIELLTRQFVKQLEEVVRKYPEQWFNFYGFWKEERCK
jgi:predicted LPLAT superfamily acyltransferase